MNFDILKNRLEILTKNFIAPDFFMVYEGAFFIEWITDEKRTSVEVNLKTLETVALSVLVQEKDSSSDLELYLKTEKDWKNLKNFLIKNL